MDATGVRVDNPIMYRCGQCGGRAHFGSCTPIQDEIKMREDQVAKEERIRSEREAVYGEPRDCHTRIGEVWGTLLTHAGWKVGTAVEPHLVAACMAVLKVVRGVTGGAEFSQDSYDDAHVYLRFCELFHPKSPK